MNEPKGITLDLLSKTALQIAALSREPHWATGLVERAEEAYRFLELCEHTLKSMPEKQRAREEFERKLASERIPTSKAVKEITGKPGSHYRKRFFKFVNDSFFRRYAEEFEKTIPCDLIPDPKKDYQEWNEYQRDLGNTKKALKAHEPNEDARKRIDLAPMFSMLPRDSQKSSKKSS